GAGEHDRAYGMVAVEGIAHGDHGLDGVVVGDGVARFIAVHRDDGHRAVALNIEKRIHIRFGEKSGEGDQHAACPDRARMSSMREGASRPANGWAWLRMTFPRQGLPGLRSLVASARWRRVNPC